MHRNGTAPLLAGPFSTVVCDPPWPYNRTANHPKLLGYIGTAERVEYETLTIADLALLPVGAAVSGYLFLWCPGPFLGQGFKLIEAWGFQYVTAIHWLKRTKNGKVRYGAGYWYRGSVETILVAKKKGAPSIRTQQRNVFEWLHPGPHSEKPEGLQEHIEVYFPGPYLELFARRVRPGWTCLGDECSGDGSDIRASLPALLRPKRRRLIKIP